MWGTQLSLSLRTTVSREQQLAATARQPLRLPPRHLCHETCQAGVVRPSSSIFGFRPSHFWTMWTLLAVVFVSGISAIGRIALARMLPGNHSRHQTRQWVSVPVVE